MAKDLPSVGDLRSEATIEDAEITEAVAAYLADPKRRIFQFASGHVVNVGAAVEAHRPAKAILAGKITSDAYRRSIIRAAVLLAPVVSMQQALS